MTQLLDRRNTLANLHFAMAGLLLLTLAGCGGSDSGSPPINVPPSTPTPSPTSSPTPAPTPTPTATPAPPDQIAGSGPTLLSLTAATPLIGTVGDNSYIRSSNGTITQTQTYGTGSSNPVIFNGDTGGLIYNVPTFLVPELPLGTRFTYSLNQAKSDDTWLIYQASINGTVYSAKQLLIGNRNETIRLLFSSIALLEASNTNASTNATAFSIAPISYGVQFDPATRALTGKVSYDGIVLGLARGENGSNVYEVTGKIQLAIDLATTDFSGYVDLQGTNNRAGSVVNFGRFTFAADRPRGALDLISASSTDFRLQGNFAGNEAQEFFGGSDIYITDPQQPATRLKITFAFAGRR